MPLNQLAAEIEWALTYTLACGVGAGDSFETRRKAVCAHMVAVLAERAGNGLSGMRIEPVIAKPG